MNRPKAKLLIAYTQKKVEVKKNSTATTATVVCIDAISFYTYLKGHLLDLNSKNV